MQAGTTAQQPPGMLARHFAGTARSEEKRAGVHFSCGNGQKVNINQLKSHILIKLRISSGPGHFIFAGSVIRCQSFITPIYANQCNPLNQIYNKNPPKPENYQDNQSILPIKIDVSGVRGCTNPTNGHEVLRTKTGWEIHE
jgi:hypothetical protein